MDKGIFENDLLNKALDKNVALEERIQELDSVCKRLTEKYVKLAKLGARNITRIQELEAAIREHKYQCDGHTYPAEYDYALYAVLDNKEEG